MDSSLLTSSETEAAIVGIFDSYRATLAKLSRPELLAHLTEINGQLETQARQTVANTLAPSAGLSDFLTALDRPQIRSIERDPSSSHRGRAAQDSPRSQPRSPLDLLAGSSRLGPRLAAKLVAASVRASGRRDRG